MDRAFRSLDAHPDAGADGGEMPNGGDRSTISA